MYLGMMSKEKRAAVISLHNEGVPPVNIAKRLIMDLSTVCKQIKRYKELGSLMDRPRSGRPVTACTSSNRNKIKKRIQRNPERSMRAMGKGLKISETSVQRIVKTQLGYRSYKFSKAQVLTEKMKENRLQKAKKMLRQSAAGRHRSILFTDKKIFTVEVCYNHQKGSDTVAKRIVNVSRCFDHYSKPFPISCYGLGWGHSQWEDTIGVRCQERKDKCSILPTTDSERCVRALGMQAFWKPTMDASTRLDACTFSQNDYGSL